MLLHATVVRSFRTWQYQATELLRQRHILKRVVARMANGILSAAFVAWEHVRQRSRALQKKKCNVLRKWMHKHIASAFRRWHQHTAEKNLMKKKAQKIAIRLLNGGEWVGIPDPANTKKCSTHSLLTSYFETRSVPHV